MDRHGLLTVLFVIVEGKRERETASLKGLDRAREGRSQDSKICWR